ncbi:MAG TPA: hypothetical protein VII40_07390 [Xanthobacteraceae bacterium]
MRKELTVALVLIAIGLAAKATLASDTLVGEDTVTSAVPSALSVDEVDQPLDRLVLRSRADRD